MHFLVQLWQRFVTTGQLIHNFSIAAQWLQTFATIGYRTQKEETQYGDTSTLSSLVNYSILAS